MDTLHYFEWFGWSAVMFALLHVFQIPLRKTNYNLHKLKPAE